jgi:phage terminase small subunit
MSKMSFISKSKESYTGASPLKNIRFEKFAQQFVRTNNITLSAITAGYSRKTAPQRGSFLRNKSDISKRIDFMLERLANKSIWDKQKIIEKLQLEAEAQTNKAYERIRALELLGKSKAIFIERIRHYGEVKSTNPVICVINKETEKELKNLITG